jgi:hypothetical protein
VVGKLMPIRAALSVGKIRLAAWRVFTAWSGVDVDPQTLTAGQRWSVITITVAGILRRRSQGVRFWLLSSVPTWNLAARLERQTHRWYRIPSRQAAEHVRLRLDMWPLNPGDYVRIERGRLTAVAYSTSDWSEIIFVGLDGEVEPDPRSPEMARAWRAYWRSMGR